MFKKQVWVRHNGEWVKCSSPPGLTVEATDFAHRRIEEGYRVCITDGPPPIRSNFFMSHDLIVSIKENQ